MIKMTQEIIFLIFFLISLISFIHDILRFKRKSKIIHKRKHEEFIDVFAQLFSFIFTSPSQLWFLFPILPQPRLQYPYLIISIISGLIILIIGLYVLLLVRRELGRSGFKESPSLESHEFINDDLIITGIYSRSRHPMYLSVLLIFSGYFLITIGLYTIILIPYVFLLFCIYANWEDKELENKYGKKHKKYKKNVPMFFPKIIRKKIK
jgi:protein-S-isoprenylcysteine O-methyltransferase Ste14